MKYLKEAFKESDIGQLYTQCDTIEKILLTYVWIASCVIPFGLIASLGSLETFYSILSLWVSLVIVGYVFKVKFGRRTGKKISVSFIPKFN